MKLREYQSAALAEARAHVQAGNRRPLIVMPTGGGKTCTASEGCRTHVANGGTVVWLAHRRELIKQAAKTLTDYGLRVGALGLDAAAPVQVASIQTLLKRGEAPPATMVVADEAHHLMADEWKKLAEVYSEQILLGLTATPERGDGRPMGDVFNALVVAAQVKDLIDLHAIDPTQGLVPCDVIFPVGLDGEPRVLGSTEIAQNPVEAYLEHGMGKRAVLFASNTKAAHEFRHQFEAKGIRAETVTAKTPKDERDSILELFRRGDVRVVTNVGVLTEGWDDPGCKVCIIARGCDHASLYLQMTGRVLRPYPGETHAIVLDLRGVYHIHGSPAAERQFSLDGIAIAQKEVQEERHCSIHSVLFENGSCPLCEKGASVEMKTPHSVDAKLGKASWQEFQDHDPPAARTAKLAQYLRDGLAKGNKPMSAFIKFKYTYKYFPSKQTQFDALRLAGVPWDVASEGQ